MISIKKYLDMASGPGEPVASKLASSKQSESKQADSGQSGSKLADSESGEVVAANGLLSDTPETVNQAPEASGWFVKIKLSHPVEVDALMDRAGYETFLATL